MQIAHKIFCVYIKYNQIETIINFKKLVIIIVLFYFKFSKLFI